MKIHLLNLRLTHTELEVMFQVVSTEENDADMEGNTLGFDVLTFLPNATAKEITDTIQLQARHVRETGIKRHKLQTEIKELLDRGRS